MSRFIPFFIAIFCSGSAIAEWTQIGDHIAKTKGVDTGRGVKTFVMKDTIARNGDRVVMWTLRDYESPVKVENKKQFSSMSLEEYDCENVEYKTLSFYWYSKQQAKGKTVYSDNSHGDMQPIIPDSLVHDAWKIACGKK